MIAYRNKATGAYAELIDTTPVAWVLRELDGDAQQYIHEDDFDSDWEPLSEFDALAEREWATNREFGRHCNYCGVCNSGVACEDYAALRARLDAVRAEISQLPQPRYSVEKFTSFKQVAWRLRDHLAGGAWVWDNNTDRYLSFPEEIDALAHADRRNLEERIVASIHEGDTVEAEYNVTLDGVQGRRTVRLTVDRTPWTFGAGGAAITNGGGPYAVITSSIRVVSRAAVNA